MTDGVHIDLWLIKKNVFWLMKDDLSLTLHRSLTVESTYVD
jgi:hypothetical protein